MLDDEMMDWMLEQAKKKPMKAHHDFDTRFRVWVEQIIPSRLNAIRQCDGDVDYAVRMVKLTHMDAHRLRMRALYEYADYGEMVDYTNRVDAVLRVLIEAIGAYLNEVKE